jgi:cell division protease FtsH
MKNNQNMKKGMFPYFLLLVIGVSIMFFYSMTNDMNKEFTYNEFNKALKENKVKEVVITPSTSAYTYQITGKLKGAKEGETFSVKTPLSDTVIKKIIDSSEEKDFKIVSKSDPTASTWYVFLVSVAP